MSDGMIRMAVKNLVKKYIPQKTSSDIYVPSEAYRGIMDLLEIWGSQAEDPEIQEKTKYIYDQLLEAGDPREQIISIVTALGVTPIADSKVNRVWKFVHLTDKAKKTRAYYDNIQAEIHSLHKKKEVAEEVVEE